MKLSSLSLGLLALVSISCTSQETDGRAYYGGNTPIQSRMGVQYKRVKSANSTPATRVEDGSLFGSIVSDEPPGLLDRNEKPDEPGAEYWVHGEQSANPVQSRMGVRVSRRKK